MNQPFQPELSFFEDHDDQLDTAAKVSEEMSSSEIRQQALKEDEIEREIEKCVDKFGCSYNEARVRLGIHTNEKPHPTSTFEKLTPEEAAAQRRGLELVRRALADARADKPSENYDQDLLLKRVNADWDEVEERIKSLEN